MKPNGLPPAPGVGPSRDAVEPGGAAGPAGIVGPWAAAWGIPKAMASASRRHPRMRIVRRVAIAVALPGGSNGHQTLALSEGLTDCRPNVSTRSFRPLDRNRHGGLTT